MSYAPASHLLTQAKALPALTTPSSLTALATMIVQGTTTASSNVDPNKLLSPQVKQFYPLLDQTCLPQLAQTRRLGGIAPADMLTGANKAPIYRVLDAENPDVITNEPVFLAQGTADTTVFPQFTTSLSHELKALGTRSAISSSTAWTTAASSPRRSPTSCRGSSSVSRRAAERRARGADARQRLTGPSDRLIPRDSDQAVAVRLEQRLAARRRPRARSGCRARSECRLPPRGARLASGSRGSLGGRQVAEPCSRRVAAGPVDDQVVDDVPKLGARRRRAKKHSVEPGGAATRPEPPLRRNELAGACAA